MSQYKLIANEVVTQEKVDRLNQLTGGKPLSLETARLFMAEMFANRETERALAQRKEFESAVKAAIQTLTKLEQQANATISATPAEKQAISDAIVTLATVFAPSIPDWNEPS